MQSNSQTTGLCACVRLLLALHSIPVVEGTLAVVDIPVAADHTLAALGTLVVAADTPVALDILAAEGDILVALDILVVDILEAASAALQIRVAVAQEGPHVPHALLLVALQVVALLVVRMVAPGCS
jgi:hypothetical protein